MAKRNNRKNNRRSGNNYSQKSGTGSGRSPGTGGKKRGRQISLRKPVSAVLLVLMFLVFFGLQNKERNGAADTGSTSAHVSTSEQEDKSAETVSEEAVEGDSGNKGESAGDSTGTYAEAAGETAADVLTQDMLPPYSGQPYADIGGDVPFFTEEEMTSEAFHEYWPLDALGRCTGAYACVGPETLPKQKRGDISSVKPTGWHTDRYDDIDGEMLFNRCHLIGHMLTGQDANERNLVTGTRYMNTEGMLPFEESVLMYIEGTGHHVMYRVRPYFEGDNLVCTGVLMEAKSVEDPLVQFCAFCYNVQPGFEIDYATGDNRRATQNK